MDVIKAVNGLTGSLRGSIQGVDPVEDGSGIERRGSCRKNFPPFLSLSPPPTDLTPSRVFSARNSSIGKAPWLGTCFLGYHYIWAAEPRTGN